MYDSISFFLSFSVPISQKHDDADCSKLQLDFKIVIYGFERGRSSENCCRYIIFFSLFLSLDSSCVLVNLVSAWNVVFKIISLNAFVLIRGVVGSTDVN